MGFESVRMASEPNFKAILDMAALDVIRPCDHVFRPCQLSQRPETMRRSTRASWLIFCSNYTAKDSLSEGIAMIILLGMS